ncbi:MAG: YdcF family protein [Sphingobacteriia bacterium]|nr:YdcF family protein [Sphingobacteriia bacterium]
MKIISFKTKVFVYFSQILLISWILGFLWFVGQVKNRTEHMHIPKKVDAVIIITGGKGRIEEGIKLFEEKEAKRMLISGVGKAVDFKSLEKQVTTKARKTINNSKDKITLSEMATSTRLNAVEADIWLEYHNLKSYILVTSDYHAVRSKFLFNKIVDKKMYMYAINASNFKIDKWWDFPGTFELIFTEYNKFIFTVLFSFIGILDLL